jgi:hypothetical protein
VSWNGVSRWRPKPNRIAKCRKCKRSYWLCTRNVGLDGFCSAACKEAYESEKTAKKAKAAGGGAS